MELPAATTASTHPAGPRSRYTHCCDRNQLEPDDQHAHARACRAVVGRYPGHAHGATSGLCRFLLSRGGRYSLSFVYQQRATADGDVTRDASVLTSATQSHSGGNTTRTREPVCHAG